MTDEKSGTRSSVGLLDIASRVPGLLMDAPTILRGVVTGFLARPTAKTSIGKVFQDRAAQLRRQGLPQIRRPAAHLPARPTRPSTATPRCWPRAGSATATSSASCCATRPNAVLMMLAAVKCGADRRACSTTTSAATCSRTASVCSTPRCSSPRPTSSSRSTKAAPTPTGADRPIEELRASWPRTAPTDQPGRRRRRCWPRTRRSTSSPRAPPGMPKASVMTHYRWLRALAGVRRPRAAAQQQRHPVLLPAALPQQRADGRAVVGAQRRVRRWRWASRSRRRSSGTT